MSDENNGIEYDEYLYIWTFNEADALACFGLSADTHTVVLLKDKPTSEREIAKYRDDAKLFGIKRREDV